MKLADAKFNKRLCARLAANSEALQAVEARLGMDRRMVERFRLGLSEPYPKSAASAPAVTHQDVLVAPICNADGRFYAPYMYQALPTITIDNRIDPPESWSTGDSESYFSRKREPDDVVIVCEDVRDLWALTALIRGTVLETTHVVLAPTQRGKWPNAWRTPEFWKSWKRVNVAVGTGQASGTGQGVERDEKARTLARMMNRDVHRVLPHKASSWLQLALMEFDTTRSIGNSGTLPS